MVMLKYCSPPCALTSNEPPSEDIHYLIFTARKRSLGQGNVFTSVCHSVHGGTDPPGYYAIRWTSGRYASLLPPANVVCEGYVFTRVCHSFCSQGGGGEYLTRCNPPWPGTPPGTRYTPQDQVHPPEQSMLGDTVNVRAVRILLECNLVLLIFFFFCQYFFFPKASKRISETYFFKSGYHTRLKAA